MTPEQESKFLDVMLTERNLELALQLDTDPSTDRLLNTPEVVRRPLIIVGGGSHASRLANALGSINPEVVDLSIGGWKVTEDNVRDLATDIGDALEAAESPEGCTIVLQLLDNSLFKGGSKTSQIYPVKLGGTFHIVGELSTINEDKFKEIFKMVIPIFRAARGSRIILIGPLARYVIQKCCEDPQPVSNADCPTFVEDIRAQLLSLGKLLKNLVHLRRLKHTKVLNLAVLMGLTFTSPDDLHSLWGTDPVHPTAAAYDTMATNLMDEIDSDTVLHSRLPSAQWRPD